MSETSLKVIYFIPISRTTKFIQNNPDISILRLVTLIRDDNKETLGATTPEIYRDEKEWFDMDPDVLYADLLALKVSKKLEYLPFTKTVRSFLNGTPTTFWIIMFTSYDS